MYKKRDSGNTVTSSGIGANGIFAYGTVRITTTGDKFIQTVGGGYAIMCCGGGTIVVKKDSGNLRWKFEYNCH